MENINGVDVLNFEEAMNEATQVDGDNIIEPCALLGNGFSVALKKDIFSYASLKAGLDVNSFHLKDKIHNVFDYLGTDDFEKVIKILLDSFIVTQQYPLEGHEKLNDDVEQLKKELVKSISSHHPLIPDEDITAQNYENNRNFLKRFAKIFTTNYDLLLYWSVLRNGLTYKFSDGFKSLDGKLYWAGKGQELYWLHGGLHLYWDNDDKFPGYTEIIKLRKGILGKNLVDQIQEKLDQGSFPITVAEGDWKSKIKRISSNPYLKEAFQELMGNERNIVTFGIGFGQDDHIIKAIKASPNKKIYVGVHNPDTAKINSLKMKLLPLTDAKKEIYFYRSETAIVW